MHELLSQTEKSNKYPAKIYAPSSSAPSLFEAQKLYKHPCACSRIYGMYLNEIGEIKELIDYVSLVKYMKGSIIRVLENFGNIVVHQNEQFE